MRFIFVIVVAIFLTIVGLGSYLSPNDLTTCGPQPSQLNPCKEADAIVAVSGGDTTARTEEAIKLYKNGWAPKLIFSGAAQDKSGPSNAEAMRRIARTDGVPDEDILVEEYSATTKENAENTQTLFQRNNISSVILVTSAYHQRRAGLEFEKRANSQVSIRNHPADSDNQWSRWWWLTPTGWFLAIGESFKILVFYLGGIR